MLWGRLRTTAGETLTGVIEGDRFFPRAALGAEEAVGADMSVDDGVLLPPVEPGKFFGLWNNFHSAAERNGWTPPRHPLYFFKPPTSLAGPGAEVAVPDGVGRVLFEGELGIVVGTPCKAVSETEAEAHILGYTCVNDLTALNILTEDESFPQWTRAKGYDGFGVIGPVIATGLDWRELTVRVTVNGRERQRYPCSDMIMSPPEIISKLSQDMTLEAGDVIACGTSIGARPVKPGDEVVVSIDGIGDLPVSMVAG